MTLFERFLKKSKPLFIGFGIVMVLIILLGLLDVVATNHLQLVGTGVLLTFLFILFMNLVQSSKSADKGKPAKQGRKR